MPSKNENLSDLTARNRVNQRNFRNRKVQYTKDLEAKVRTYEEDGVRATAEVQAAARRVVDENNALKEVLRRELGLSDEDISRRVVSLLGVRSLPPQLVQTLSTSNDDSQNYFMQNKHYTPSTNDHSQAYVDAQVTARAALSSPTVEATPSMSDSGMQQKPIVALFPPDMRFEPQGHLSSGRAASEERLPPTSSDETHELRPIIHQNFEQLYEDVAIDPRLEGIAKANGMTCEEAAEIMTSIKFNASVEDAREELGCKTDGQSCRVGHAKLFDLLNNSMG